MRTARLRGPALCGRRLLSAFTGIFRVKAVLRLLPVGLRRRQPGLLLPLVRPRAIGLRIIAAEAKRRKFLQKGSAALGFGMFRRKLATMRTDLVLRRQRQVLHLRHSLLPDNGHIGNKGA